jgi:hypothetical protein
MVADDQGRKRQDRLIGFAFYLLRERLQSVTKWLPLRHVCCLIATVNEDLTLIPTGSCVRRFLATPLHEIILRRLMATALAKAKENPVSFRICIFRV